MRSNGHIVKNREKRIVLKSSNFLVYLFLSRQKSGQVKFQSCRTIIPGRRVDIDIVQGEGGGAGPHNTCVIVKVPT